MNKFFSIYNLYFLVKSNLWFFFKASVVRVCIYWMTHPFVLRAIRPSADAPPVPSPSPLEHVFVRIIMRSVRMLGRRTFGATTPHASLRRRFIESVTFFERFEGTCGGSVHGDPNAVLTRLWWFGAISGGSVAALKSS